MHLQPVDQYFGSLCGQGHTFCTTVPFLKVVEAVAECAFVTSHLSVITSMEMHCSPKQQAIQFKNALDYNTKVLHFCIIFASESPGKNDGDAHWRCVDDGLFRPICELPALLWLAPLACALSTTIWLQRGGQSCYHHSTWRIESSFRGRSSNTGRASPEERANIRYRATRRKNHHAPHVSRIHRKTPQRSPILKSASPRSECHGCR